MSKPLEGGEIHLWPGVESPQPASQCSGSMKFTANVRMSEATSDVEALNALVHNTVVSYGDKVKYIRNLEHKWAFKAMDQQAEYLRQASEKRGAWAEAEDTMFECSSDDSDGIDADHDEEWGENTREVFGASRALEVNPASEEAVEQFSAMLSNLYHADISLTEQLMVWSAVRIMYRRTEPVHWKQWLTGCTDLVSGVAFKNRPSLASFLHVATLASQWPGLSTRHQQKAERWAKKCMVLFHKRVTALKEFGTPCPSWEQVNVSQGARASQVPSVLIHDVIACAGDTPAQVETAFSSPIAKVPEAVTKKLCKEQHQHFPCDGSQARPHVLSPD